MSCTLQKFNRYPVSQIIKDNGTGRVLVKLGVDIPTCPDGVLNNSHTKIVEDSNAQMSVLTFDDKAGVPVVFRSLSTPITYLENGQATVGVNAGESMSSGWGIFTWAGVAILFIGTYLVIRRMLMRPTLAHANAYDSYSGAGGFSPRTTFAGSGSVAPAGGTTIVNNNGSGHTSGLVEGAIVGGLLGYEAGRASTPSAPEKKDDSFKSDSSSSFSSDSDSSYGSDSSSSYGSDSSSSSSDSSSSDSGSSFGSDSSSSSGSDSSSSFGDD